MSAGKNLDDRVKGLIAEISLQHPDWLGKQVHVELHRRLEATAYPRDDPEWPRLSAVHKELARQEDQRAKLGENPNDRPWSLAALSFTDIPPGALPAITRVWARVVAVGAEPALTIRQVRWMGRLYLLFPRDDLLLLAVATYLALQERVLEVAGGYPSKDEDAWWFWTLDYAASLGVEPSDDIVDRVAERLAERIRANMKSTTQNHGPVTERELQALRVRAQSPDTLLLILAMQHDARKAGVTSGKETVGEPAEASARIHEGGDHEGTHQEAERG